jgi:hypothetical protein
VAEALHQGATATVPDLIETLTSGIEETWTVTPQTAILTAASPRFMFGRP